MTPAEPRSAAGSPQPVPERAPRLRLKPRALATGCVDGAWWPRSIDLDAELPDLLAVLSVRLGRVSYVTYQTGEWASPPERFILGDRVIRLAAHRRQPRNTVEILGVGGTSVVLLVVPPGAEPDQAHSTMMAAAAPNNASTTTGLLAVGRH